MEVIAKEVQMIRVKHFMADCQIDDGQRLWVESIGLTRDLQEMCQVHHVLSHLGPPMKLWLWYESHPDGWEHFRSKYHAHLSSGPYVGALKELAAAAMHEEFTFLHQNDNPHRNAAIALAEFVAELHNQPGKV